MRLKKREQVAGKGPDGVLEIPVSLMSHMLPEQVHVAVENFMAEN